MIKPNYLHAEQFLSKEITTLTGALHCTETCPSLPAGLGTGAVPTESLLLKTLHTRSRSKNLEEQAGHRVQVELSLKQPSDTAFLTLYRHRADHCIPFCCFFRKPSISNLTNVFIYSHSFWNETNRQKAKRQQQHCQIYARDKATAIWISDSSLTCIKLVCIVSFSL